MISSFEERSPDSPYIDSIWRAQLTGGGTLHLAAKGHWDIVVERRADGRAVVVCSAPASVAKSIPYNEEGSEYIGITLTVGAFLTVAKEAGNLDAMHSMPQTSKTSFRFDGARLDIPDFMNAETFVSRLVRSQLLRHDKIITSVMQGERYNTSDRSVQRHFASVVGLTHNSVKQIARAHRAAALLRAGQPAAAVAQTTGYSDHAHLTKSLKRILGQTPSQIGALHA